MQRPDENCKNSDDGLARRPNEIASDCYEGVELAPRTLESLVTWDVSGHAQREKDRLNPAYRTAKTIKGGY
jgi:hypothetical protein